MLDTFQNIFKIPELKKRVLFALGMLAVYRIGCHIPTPGIDGQALAHFFKQAQGTLLGMFDMFSGGALEKLTVFALGIMPYISSSIIFQLLTVRNCIRGELFRAEHLLLRAHPTPRT